MDRKLARNAVAILIAIATARCLFAQADESASFSVITNSITERINSFNTRLRGWRPRSEIASDIYNDVAAITNIDCRIAAARHFAAEVLSINVSNENYRIRDSVIFEMPRVISRAWNCLIAANVSEPERLKFLFDALERYKYGCYVTSLEPPITAPVYGDYGRILQESCSMNILNMNQAKTHLSFTRYREFYPSLTSEGKEYFQTRYRAVFGMDFTMPKKE